VSRPAGRSDAGHRLYGTEAVEQLYRISLLRQLGLSLDQVGAALETADTDVQSLIADHLVTIGSHP
jgi:DNA-binding transcriptional MerR regulator